MRVGSASALPLLNVCEGAGVLETVGNTSDRADVGSALHHHMHMRSALGVDDAMTRLDSVARIFGLSERDASIFEARARGFEWCPPRGSIGEVSLCLCEDGSVVRVKGGRGKYDDLPAGALIPGQIDLMWSEPEPLDFTDPEHPRCPLGSTLWVLDYKSGDDAWVEPVEKNAQIAAYLVMAAKWTGATRAIPSILFIRKGMGDWDTPPTSYGPAKLAATEEWVVGIRRAQVAAAERFEKTGAMPRLVTGKHCDFCGAQSRCPEKTAMLKKIMGGAVPNGNAPLTREERVFWAENASFLTAAAKHVSDALKASVKADGDIVLRDGRVFGRVQKKRTKILPGAAKPVLEEMLGEHLAESVVRVTISGDDISDAIKTRLAADGKTRGVAPMKRELWAKLGSSGALLSEPREEFRVHRPDESDDDDDVAAQ